jgi:hypothetical protein
VGGHLRSVCFGGIVVEISDWLSSHCNFERTILQAGFISDLFFDSIDFDV